MGMVETYDAILPIYTGFVPDTMPRGDGARAKEPFHLVADRTRRRHLQDVQQVVTKELAAPYTSYVHCTIGGTASPNQLSNWWLLGGSEKWETLNAASQEINFDDELRKAATVIFKDTEGNDR